MKNILLPQIPPVDGDFKTNSGTFSKVPNRFVAWLQLRRLKIDNGAQLIWQAKWL